MTGSFLLGSGGSHDMYTLGSLNTAVTLRGSFGTLAIPVGSNNMYNYISNTLLTVLPVLAVMKSENGPVPILVLAATCIL